MHKAFDMNKLPQEVVDLIIYELYSLILDSQDAQDEPIQQRVNILIYSKAGRPPETPEAKTIRTRRRKGIVLSPYTTVNQQFQSTIENKTFHSLDLAVQDITHLHEMVSRSPHRAKLIKDLFVSIIIPPFQEAVPVYLESTKAWDHYNLFLTNSIAKIMKMINSWEAHTSNPIINLKIEIAPEKLDYPGHPRAYSSSCYDRCTEGRNLLSFVNEIEISICTLINSINILYIGDTFIEPSSLVSLYSKCKQLNTIVGIFYDLEMRFVGIKTRLRTDLAQSLYSLPIHNLEKIDLEFEHMSPIWEPPTLLLKDDPKDYLSLSLHKLSLAPNLRQFTLIECPVSPCLFWPNPEDGLSVPFWPKLEHFTVALASSMPNGQRFEMSTDNEILPTKHVSEIQPPIPGFEDNTEFDLDWKVMRSKWQSDPQLEAQAAQFLGERMYRSRNYRNFQFDGKPLESLGLSMMKASQNMPKIKVFDLLYGRRPPPHAIRYRRDRLQQDFGWRIDCKSNDPWRPTPEFLQVVNTYLKQDEALEIRVSE